MPEGAAGTQNRGISDVALPYISYGTPISDVICFVQGFNVMTSQKKSAERRPAFSGKLEAGDPTKFSGTIKRLYGWRKWPKANVPGNFFVMLSVINGGNSEVWKLEIGVDAAFQQIFVARGTEAPFDFYASSAICFMGNGVAGFNLKYDGVVVTKWGFDPPTYKPLATLTQGGTLDAAVDLHYCYTWYDERYAHESSPSDVSDCLGPFSNRFVDVTVYRPTDTQATHLKVYRSRDGGSLNSEQMQEIPGSPFVLDRWDGSAMVVRDNSDDADLQDEFAPALMRNDPPPPLFALAGANGRIFGIRGDERDEVWFSGFDEISNGMPEQCFPGGLSGNYYPFNDEVTALSPLAAPDGQDGMSCFLPSRIFAIAGERRNEMFRYRLEDTHGARASTSVTPLGMQTVWLDTAKQIRGSSEMELSQDIRPDVIQISHSTSYLVPYVYGEQHWLCLLDGTSGKLYVLDLDTQRWMLPWPIGASLLAQAEISPGQRVLIAAIDNQIWYMKPGTYQDKGSTTYAAQLTTSLVPVTPETQIDLLATLDSIIVKRMGQKPSVVSVATDEDPDSAKYTDITATVDDVPHRKRGDKLIVERYIMNLDPTEYVSLHMEWPADNSNFELLTLNVESHPMELAG
jgi:hypothetical protein